MKTIVVTIIEDGKETTCRKVEMGDKPKFSKVTLNDKDKAELRRIATKEEKIDVGTAR